MKVIVTGGAGFIGSAVIRRIIETTDLEVINVDCLTYAANLDNLACVAGNSRYRFLKVDIRDATGLNDVFMRERPDAVVHLAAESHVDRSIDGPSEFIQTNIVGTYNLLEASRAHFLSASDAQKSRFRFLHVSTDEVFGSLGDEGLFREDTPYRPNSPYSASKAASDHLVQAWFRTFELPTLITNCSNNYGPYQFPEKLIPLVVRKALAGESLPVYGKGENVRDWLYVDDHADALLLALAKGQPGETYNIGGHCERRNVDVVRQVCSILDDLLPSSPNGPHEKLITFVQDRPGHDFRYAIDSAKIRSELGWRPRETFETGLRKTIEWYMANGDWCGKSLESGYHGERLGILESARLATQAA